FELFSSIKNYDPVVVIFNCRKSAGELSMLYGVEKVFTVAGNFDFKLVHKMAEKLDLKKSQAKLAMMEEKLQKLKQEKPSQYKNVKASALREPKLFIGKHDKMSVARIKIDAKILALSESEIWFTTKEDLYFGIYEIDLPTKIRFTLAPDPDSYEHFTAEKSGNIYHGLVHSFDENGKKLLRQEVNRIFFSDLTAQRELESKEYETLTKQALEKKMEELEKLKKMMELNEIKKKI
ncbi:MAG: hypothetical protein ACON4M_00545, partial [Crocinitomicaceae bacterium]